MGQFINRVGSPNGDCAFDHGHTLRAWSIPKHQSYRAIALYFAQEPSQRLHIKAGQVWCHDDTIRQAAPNGDADSHYAMQCLNVCTGPSPKERTCDLVRRVALGRPPGLQADLGVDDAPPGQLPHLAL